LVRKRFFTWGSRKADDGSEYFHRADNGGALQSRLRKFRPTPSRPCKRRVKDFTTTANAFFTSIMDTGRCFGGPSLASADDSHQFLRRLTLSGEIWHFTQPFSGAMRSAKSLCASYAPRKTLVLMQDQSRADGHIHKLGGVRGLTYLLPASPLEGAIAPIR